MRTYFNQDLNSLINVINVQETDLESFGGGIMPLHRPCDDCEKRFKPTARRGFYCPSCNDRRKKEGIIKMLLERYPNSENVKKLQLTFNKEFKTYLALKEVEMNKDGKD